MTAQVPDTIVYMNEQYSLIGASGGVLASPEQFGMEPVPMHTACYRGFIAGYELTDKGLFLRELTLREKDEAYVAINGVQPEFDDRQAIYKELDVFVPFTGRIRLAKGFIKELYVHMGFQKATAFEKVLDVTLEKGQPVEIKDRSDDVSSRRGEFKKRYQNGKNIVKNIADSFSLDMDLE